MLRNFDYYDLAGQYAIHPMGMPMLDACTAAAAIHAENNKFLLRHFTIQPWKAGENPYGPNPDFRATTLYRHISNTKFSVFIELTRFGYVVNYYDDLADYGSIEAYFDKGKVKEETYKYLELLQTRVYMDLLALQQERAEKLAAEKEAELEKEKFSFVDIKIDKPDGLKGLPTVEDVEDLPNAEELFAMPDYLTEERVEIEDLQEIKFKDENGSD